MGLRHRAVTMEPLMRLTKIELLLLCCGSVAGWGVGGWITRSILHNIGL